MKNSFKRTFALVNRNLKEIIRDPISLIFLLGLPLIMLVLFYYLFSNATPQFRMSYLAPSMVVFGNSFVALFVGILISLDRSSSFLTRLYTTPTRSFEFVLGYSIAELPIGLVQGLLFFVTACIIDSSFFSVNLLLALLVSIFSVALFVAFGILFGSLCNEKSVGGVTSILITAQSVLSGMWFPLDTLSEGFNKFIECLPFRSASLLMQNVANGNVNDFFVDFCKPLLIVLCYTVLVFVLAIIVFKNKMKER